MPFPRILTVDPSGSIARQIRSALDLMELSAVQVDAPNAEEALTEIQQSVANLVVAAWQPGDNMQGWQLAGEIQKHAPDTPIVIVADYDDSEIEDTPENFIYLKRPFDGLYFMKLVQAAVDGQDIFKVSAVDAAPAASGGMVDLGPVPPVDLARCNPILENLLQDISAMSVLLVSRPGEVLLQSGALSYLDRDTLAQRLVPGVITNVQLRDLVGGNAAMIQFYDGSDHDVFVITIGFHYFLCIVFDGQSGSRQFGVVNRFGRRAAEDIIGVMGTAAWLIERPTEAAPPRPAPEASRRRPAPRPAPPAEAPKLERAVDPIGAETGPIPKFEDRQKKLEPVTDIDIDALFSDNGSAGDDLFDDLEDLEKLARFDEKGLIDDKKARELGLLGD